MARRSTEEDRETMRRMRKAGESISAIVRATGLNRDTIRSKLGENKYGKAETTEEVEYAMREVANREASKPHRAWQRHGPTIPLAVPVGITVADKIATLLCGGHDPAAIATVLRCRFGGEVMAVVKRLDADFEAMERTEGIQNELSPIILTPEELDKAAETVRSEAPTLEVGGRNQKYTPKAYIACVAEPDTDLRCGEFPAGEW